MTTTSGKRALAKARFLRLVDDLKAQLGSERKATRRLGCHATLPGKLRSDPKRFVGMDVLERAEQRLGLSERYFTDITLGAAPDYRKYLAGARGAAAAASPYGAFNVYIDEELGAGRMTEVHARDLRLVRIPGVVTWGMASSLHREMIARDRALAMATPKSGIKSVG